MPRCTECGATIKAGSKSCEYCGSRVDVSALESVLGFVEDRVKRRDEAARAAQEAKAERARIEEERRPKVLMASALIVVVGMLLLGVMAWNEHRADGNTAAMPEAASGLKGDNYQDVKTALQAAGFTSIETSAIPDLVLGWLKKDGEVESVSVDGSTDFSADSRFPIGARVVIRYHTFPKTESGTAAASQPPANEPPVAAPQEAVDTTLTVDNSEELSDLLYTTRPEAPVVRAFAEKYVGRTIEFDGFTVDWMKHSGASPKTGKGKTSKTLYDTDIWVGDFWDSERLQMGPTFRVEGFSRPNSSPALDDADVHVIARVDGYEKDHEAIRLTLISLVKRI